MRALPEDWTHKPNTKTRKWKTSNAPEVSFMVNQPFTFLHIRL